MIQFKRGKTAAWRKLKTPLAAGQPGYDKDKHKIKIGDGKSLWSSLPNASGLTAKEILNSEEDAKNIYKADKEDVTLITYGKEDPDKNTVGQLYLQHYDNEPEVDYVVSMGINGIWTYQKWHSGIAKCWGTVVLSTAVTKAIEGPDDVKFELFHNDVNMKNIAYPFTFASVPCESATLHGSTKLAWLASKGQNTTTKSAVYSIISIGTSEETKHSISLLVEGRWK